jgi:hypothetical protein
MTRYVTGPDVAIRLARDQVAMGDEHQILAPALLRPQMLSLLCQAVHHGEMTKKMPGDGSATCAGCGSDCPESAFFRTSPRRSPATMGGPAHITPTTSL